MLKTGSQSKKRRSSYFIYNSTWIYENWVSKNFVISLNFPWLSLFIELFAYVVFLFLVVLWLGICVEVAKDTISRISI